MISTAFIDTPCSRVATVINNRWMQSAVVISLILHVGAVVVIIFLGGFNTTGKRSSVPVIQDIDVLPSISTSKFTTIAPPAQTNQIVLPPSSQSKNTENEILEPPEQLNQPAPTSIEKDGGMTTTPLGLGMTHGYFTALADGKTLRDDVRTYYLHMVETINREWWDKASHLKEPLRQDGVYEISIQRDGTVESLRLLRGTGSIETDRIISDIIRRSSPLPPLPSTYESDLFRAPLRIKAPLTLFRFKE